MLPIRDSIYKLAMQTRRLNYFLTSRCGSLLHFELYSINFGLFKIIIFYRCLNFVCISYIL